MASSHPSKKHCRNFRAITLTPVLAIVGLVSMAAIWVPTLSSAARMQPEKRNTRRGSDVAPRQQSGKLARESNVIKAPVPFAAITVDRTDDVAAASACTAAAGDCSLRGAVAFANANPGTTISVPAGTYNLTISGAGEGFSGDNSIGDLDITGNNTVIAGDGAATTIIHQTSAGNRVIEVNPFLDPNFITSISDVTVSGGTENTGVGGGGIISGAIGNSLTLTNCVISGNSATGAGSFGGGGVSHAGGSLTVTGCTFSGNSTVSGGGAIGYSAGDPLIRTPSPGTLSVTGSTFSGNTSNSIASGGGALDLFDFNLGTGSYSINSSTFSGNNATSANGGAINVESGGPFTVSTSSFTTNHAGSGGGAIYSSGSSADVRFSRLVGNTATTPANGQTFFRVAGTFTANDNWWGINTGPTTNDFQSPGGSVAVTTYLQLRATGSPSTICVGSTSTVTADIKQRNAGSPLTTELNGLPDFPASFVNATPAFGTLSGASASFVNGSATATFTGSANGTANIDVTADNETVTAAIVVEGDSTTDPADQTVCAGGTANFSTTASGPGSFTFVWKKGATVLNNGDLGGRVTITSGSNTSTLSITNVQASDADTYTVEATGSCSSVSQSASLTVNAATTATDPADQTVCQGQNATFSTMAGGTGPFSYAWTVDGSPFGGNTSSITVPTGSLSVGNHPVSVTVTGACGSATQSATLAVQSGITLTVGTSTISLWPPNHQYHTFNISDFNVTATSCADGNITNNVVIATVTSDELDENPSGADGSTINDIVIAGDCRSVKLRAERDGDLDGRVYTITLRVTDSIGNTTTATVYVTVPLNQNGGAAVNSGPHNTVNGTCP